MKKRSKPAKRTPRKPLSPRGLRPGKAPNLRVVFSAKQIESRVREIAGQINRDYQGRCLHVIGILENCFMFMADLLRELNVEVVCHFMKVETRDRPLGGHDVRELIYTPKVDVREKDVLLVDGVLHSGVLQDHIQRYLTGQGAKSVRTATLVEKSDERKVSFTSEYLGFKTRAGYLVGYGLGQDDKYRSLPGISALA